MNNPETLATLSTQDTTKTKNTKTEKKKKMINMVPTKHIGRTQVLMKGKQFLLPITHPPYLFIFQDTVAVSL